MTFVWWRTWHSQITCPQGSYCLGATADAVACTVGAGSYCPTGTTTAAGVSGGQGGCFCPVVCGDIVCMLRLSVVGTCVVCWVCTEHVSSRVVLHGRYCGRGGMHGGRRQLLPGRELRDHRGTQQQCVCIGGSLVSWLDELEDSVCTVCVLVCQTTCPQGSYCTGSTADAVPCTATSGSYCPAGSSTAAGVSSRQAGGQAAR